MHFRRGIGQGRGGDRNELIRDLCRGPGCVEESMRGSEVDCAGGESVEDCKGEQAEGREVVVEACGDVLWVCGGGFVVCFCGFGGGGGVVEGNEEGFEEKKGEGC